MSPNALRFGMCTFVLAVGLVAILEGIDQQRPGTALFGAGLVLGAFAFIAYLVYRTTKENGHH